MRPPVPLFVCALLALASCAPPSFEVELKGETFVPASPDPDSNTTFDAFPGIGSFTDLDFDKTQDFQNQGITREDVASARLVSFRLKVLSPERQDFSFLSWLECYARAKDQEVLVASLYNIPALHLSGPYPVLELKVRDAELQPLLASPALSLLIRSQGVMPEREVRLQADVKLEVKVRR
ncbi:MAG: hypothetical protein ABW123_17885 [Cystobacter sp.]